MTKRFEILGFAGSLRERSYNRALLQTANLLGTSRFKLEIVSLAEIPPYNDDLAQAAPPQAVKNFRGKIKSCDGLLIASPEYNYSISGVLKNAIDWASTATIENVLSGKKVAIMGASSSRTGTARSQMELRKVLHATRSQVLTAPELMIARAQTAFDEQGELINEKAVSVLERLLTAFYDFLSS